MIDNNFPRIEFYSMVGFNVKENEIKRGATIIYLMFSFERTLHILSYNTKTILEYNNMDKLLIDTINMIDIVEEIDPKDNNLFFSFIFSRSVHHDYVIKFLIELIYNQDIKEFYKLKYI